LARGSVVLNISRCKACGLCIEFCPQKVLVTNEQETNVLGYHPVLDQHREKCTGCAICALMCPDLVITVKKEQKQ
jgi:2-oxoglutarate ferredoxin oxidoreductase subunit delta